MYLRPIARLAAVILISCSMGCSWWFREDTDESAETDPDDAVDTDSGIDTSDTESDTADDPLGAFRIVGLFGIAYAPITEFGETYDYTQVGGTLSIVGSTAQITYDVGYLTTGFTTAANCSLTLTGTWDSAAVEVAPGVYTAGTATGTVTEGSCNPFTPSKHEELLPALQSDLATLQLLPSEHADPSWEVFGQTIGEWQAHFEASDGYPPQYYVLAALIQTDQPATPPVMPNTIIGLLVSISE